MSIALQHRQFNYLQQSNSILGNLKIAKQIASLTWNVTLLKRTEIVRVLYICMLEIKSRHGIVFQFNFKTRTKSISIRFHSKVVIALQIIY